MLLGFHKQSGFIMPLNCWRVMLWYGGEMCSHLAMLYMVLSLGVSLSINLRGDSIQLLS
jgi:hypothetical protein